MSEEMGIFETIYNCRAMRRLDRREVPQAMLEKLIEAANQAPSGSNTQNARWIVVRDPGVKAKLAELNRKGVENYLAPLIDNPGSLPHQSADKRQRMADAVVWQKEHMHEIPALIIACMQFASKPTPAMVAPRACLTSLEKPRRGATHVMLGLCHWTGSLGLRLTFARVT